MTSARILIVDDEPSVASFIEDVLTELGYSVVGSASSGEEAIEKAARLNPDLVLMDILLAGNIDGVAAGQQIQSTHKIPVVYLTGYSDDSTLQRVLISRPYGYLLKPFQINQLRVSIEVALSRNRLETAETQVENSFSAVFEGLPYSVIACDDKGLIVFMNLAAQNMTGWHLEESSGRKFEEVFNVLQQPLPAADDSLVYTIGQNEAVLITRNGRRIPIDYSSSIIGSSEKKWFITIFRNITENKRLEEALNESRMKYKGIINSIDGIVWEAEGSTGHFVFVSKQAERILGYPPQQWISDPNFWKNHIHPGDRARALNIRSNAVGQFKDYESEYRMIAASGSTIWIRDMVMVLQEPDGWAKLVGVMIDTTERRKVEEEVRKAKDQLEIRVRERTTELTKAYQKLVFELNERKKAEQALIQSEAKYRTLFEESEDTVFISSPEGRFVDINPAGVKLFGYDSKEEVLQLNIANEVYWDPEDRHRFKQLMAEKGHVKDLELAHKRKDGKKVIVLETSTVVRNESGEIVAYRGILRDVTQVKELEEQLRQAQKMEAIGHLAGGLAHDFNNILMAIMGYCELLQIKLPPQDMSQHDLIEIQKAAEAGGALIRQLLAFSRKQVLEMKTLDLSRAVMNMENFLQRLIGEDIELLIHFERPLSFIKADPVQIEQVLLNLSANARDAMPHGGRLEIQTANTVVGPESQQPPPGDYVVLIVKDTGCGMDEHTLSHLFEPFFTTKEKGKGTGLGLATVYGIVKQSGGYITVDSSPDGGSTFCAYFPRLDASPSIEIPLEEAVDFHGPGQTILLVDDNEFARKPFAQQLLLLGFSVLEANSGEEALEISRKYPGVINLLITDVVMPGIGGHDLAKSIRSERPEIKTLFISGYDEEAVSGVQFEPGTSFLAKPASRQALMQKIRELL